MNAWPGVAMQTCECMGDSFTHCYSSGCVRFRVSDYGFIQVATGHVDVCCTFHSSISMDRRLHVCHEMLCKYSVALMPD